MYIYIYIYRYIYIFFYWKITHGYCNIFKKLLNSIISDITQTMAYLKYMALYAA